MENQQIGTVSAKEAVSEAPTILELELALSAICVDIAKAQSMAIEIALGVNGRWVETNNGSRLLQAAISKATEAHAILVGKVGAK